MANPPLKGVRVIELARILAGPWAGQLLADLGADVIKVVHPARGDDTRDWGLRIGTTETAYFNSMNRNKSLRGFWRVRGPASCWPISAPT